MANNPKRSNRRRLGPAHNFLVRYTYLTPALWILHPQSREISPSVKPPSIKARPEPRPLKQSRRHWCLRACVQCFAFPQYDRARLAIDWGPARSAGRHAGPRRAGGVAPPPLDGHRPGPGSGRGPIMAGGIGKIISMLIFRREKPTLWPGLGPDGARWAGWNGDRGNLHQIGR